MKTASVTIDHYLQTVEELKKAQALLLELAMTKKHYAVLTDEEINAGLLRTNYAMQTAGAWRDGVEWAQSQLKEKNA